MSRNLVLITAFIIVHISSSVLQNATNENENVNKKDSKAVTSIMDVKARKQHEILEKQRLLCEIKIARLGNSSSACPMSWDGALCWPSGNRGELMSLPCPEYVHGFNYAAFAYRLCTENGLWFVKEETNQSWTNYTDCKIIHENSTVSLFERHVGNIKLITKIGYSVSLITLVIAFFILTFNKRLQCPRNNLHLQLFLSFIIRSSVFHIKNVFFSLSSSEYNDLIIAYLSRGDPSVQVDQHDTLVCKMFTVVWQYSLLANYNWILMEGLYLHNLIFFNIFTDNSSIIKYIIFGWGLPIMYISPWIVVKALYENKLCWTTNDNVGYFWIIRGPITLSIILNFLFFINITRVLFLKMFSSSVAQSNRRYKYSKWFKSTLVLVPLFGVHYAFFLLFNSIAQFSDTVEVVWLYVDLLFTSFQGFFVALLYCFLNGEVQQELRKLWQRWRSPHNGQPLNSTTYHSILTQSLTYLSRGRSSVLSTTETLRKESTNKSGTVSPNKKDSIHLTPYFQDDSGYRFESKENGKNVTSDGVCGSTESVL